MLFLISLAAAVFFTVLCGDILKKHPVPFYVGFTLTAVLLAVIPFKNAPGIVSDYMIAVFSKGALAAAFFVLVMFAGAFKAGTKGAKKLMPIRPELAIVASLLTITHLISYGLLYIKRLITGSISPTQAIVTYFAIPLVILLIPLAVTSFGKIRKKMDPKKWKKLQRFAYAFYVLLYAHILIAYMPSSRHGKVKSIVNVIVYSAVFLTYATMRISKVFVKKHKKSERRIVLSLSAVGAAIFAAVSLTALLPAALAKTSADISTAELPEPAASTSSVNASTKAVTESKPIAASESVDKRQNDISADTSSVGSSSSSKKEPKATSSKIGSSKAVTSQKADPTPEEQSSVQSERTVTEIEVSENREEQQESETHAQNETSFPLSEEQPEVTSEETVSETEPEPEVNRVFNDGEYTARCYEEDDDVRVMITVKLTIESDRIVDIKVYSDETDTWYLDNVLNMIVPSIVEREGSSLDDLNDIDAVSGATLSSNGVKRTVKDALDQARI